MMISMGLDGKSGSFVTAWGPLATAGAAVVRAAGAAGEAAATSTGFAGGTAVTSTLGGGLGFVAPDEHASSARATPLNASAFSECHRQFVPMAHQHLSEH